MFFFRKNLYCWRWTLGHLVQDRRQILTAVTVISLSLLILEVFILLFSNLENLVQQWAGQLRVTVFLKDSLSREELRSIERKLRQSIEYEELRYVSREQAGQDLKRDFARGELLGEIDYNLLPATFIIKLKEPLLAEKAIKETTMRLQQISGVEEVAYGGTGTDRIREVLPPFKSTILIVGIVLSLAILGIAVSIHKSSLQSWQLKIDLLQMSGMNPWLIKTPVILAGTIQGLLSVCLSLGILIILYKSFLLYFFYCEKDSYQFLASIPITFLSPGMSYGLIAGGTLLGSWSSWLALQKTNRSPK